MRGAQLTSRISYSGIKRLVGGDADSVCGEAEKGMSNRIIVESAAKSLTDFSNM